MNKTRNLLLSDFAKESHLGYVLFTCASFEKRSVHTLKAFNHKELDWVYIFTTQISQLAVDNCLEMQSFCEKKFNLYPLINGNPLSYSKAFNDAVNEAIARQQTKLCIDISTFTHEMLLILLSIVNKRQNEFECIEFIYLGAKDYSIGDSHDLKWLSKGCKEIRSVLGYPGLLSPKKQICLIVLVGYEYERAISLINEMEPDKIVIGYGKIEAGHVLSSNHIEPMRHFENIHKTWLASRSNIDKFDFSVKDVESTINAIEEKIKEDDQYDYIIVPMNTKTSTLAVGLLALENKTIQVSYAEPEMYNIENYSLPGEQIVIYKLK